MCEAASGCRIGLYPASSSESSTFRRQLSEATNTMPERACHVLHRVGSFQFAYARQSQSLWTIIGHHMKAFHSAQVFTNASLPLCATISEARRCVLSIMQPDSDALSVVNIGARRQVITAMNSSTSLNTIRSSSGSAHMSHHHRRNLVPTF